MGIPKGTPRDKYVECANLLTLQALGSGIFSLIMKSKLQTDRAADLYWQNHVHNSKKDGFQA